MKGATKFQANHNYNDHNPLQVSDGMDRARSRKRNKNGECKYISNALV